MDEKEQQQCNEVECKSGSAFDIVESTPVPAQLNYMAPIVNLYKPSAPTPVGRTAPPGQSLFSRIELSKKRGRPKGSTDRKQRNKHKPEIGAVVVGSRVKGLTLMRDCPHCESRDSDMPRER